MIEKLLRIGVVASPSEHRRLFAYHAIVSRRSEYLYDVSTDQLQQHLELFSQCSKANQQVPKFTFDDGHLSNYEKALPLLERFGVYGTFFLVAGLIGVDSKYITWRQAREILAAGHRIQSHGWSHRLLTTCNEKQLDEELVRSKGRLEDGLGVEIDSLAVPGGRWDKRVIERGARAGYKFIFHSNPWVNPAISQGIILSGRLMVTGRMTGVRLQRLLDSGPAQQMYLRTRFKMKEWVRSMLGDSLYFRMWCWTTNGYPAFGMGAVIEEGEGTPPPVK